MKQKKVKPIDRAVVLAAGFGVRMRPLSDDVPKPLMPVWNRPALYHVLDRLNVWGVQHVLINAHHGADAVWDAVRSYDQDGLALNVSYEPEILGTGGALRRASWFAGNRPFWLINADIVADLTPAPLMTRMQSRRVMAALWMTAERGPRTVRCEQGWVRDFVDPQPGTPNTATFCGLHLVSPEILKYLPKSGFASIIEAYRAAMRDGWRIAAVDIPGSYWNDIGSPEQYLAAHAEIAERSGTGLTACGASTAVIGKGSVLDRSVVWEGARLAPNTVARDAIIGRGTRVSGLVSGTAVRAEVGLTIDEQAAVQSLGFAVDRSTSIHFPARGSARSFVRVEQSRRQRAMLVRYDASRMENTYYTAQARFLNESGVRVPQVLWEDAESCQAILEDVGDQSLEMCVTKKKPGWRLGYGKVLTQVVRMHTHATAAMRTRHVPIMPGFDSKLYHWEHTLFLEQCARPVLGATDAECQAIQYECARVSRYLDARPRVLLHRDLQSSNIFLHKGAAVLIDFQGMRLGPAAYDVASLLCDPYVTLSEDFQEAWITAYEMKVGSDIFRREDFDYAAIQRLLQALGAYGRLQVLPGCARFAQYIPVARARLAAFTEKSGSFPVLTDVLQRDK